MFCPPLPGMRMRGCTDIMGKWYTLRCADSRYQGRNALRLDFRVSRGYEGVPKSRENGTPWQGRVHSPVSEQPISNRKAISVQLRYCLWGKVPQIRDKSVHFPGFGTASVGLTGHIDTAAALPCGESVPILGDCGTLSGSADWRNCLCSVLTVPRDCGRGKSVRNQRQICSLSRGDRDARVRADAICLRQDEYYNRYH